MLMNHDSFDVQADFRSVERAEKSLQRMFDWIGRHDVRTAASLGISVAMIGALASATPPAARWTTLFAATLIVAVSGLTLVIGNLIYGLFPRIRPGPSSAFFFGSIAAMEWEEYCGRFMATTERDYLQDLLVQIHINALILRAKFRAFGRAVVFLLISSGPWAMAMALGKSLC